MSIRFFCAACEQPIEVDSAWAGRLVACPFCRATIKAPLESAYGDVEAAGSAGPVLARPASPPPIPGYGAASSAKGTLAILALILALFASSTQVLFFYTVSLDKARLRVDVARIQNNPEAQEELIKEWEKSGEIPTWAWGGMGLFCISLPLLVGALVTSLIAVFRPARRGLAVTALTLTMISAGGCCLMSSLFQLGEAAS